MPTHETPLTKLLANHGESDVASEKLTCKDNYPLFKGSVSRTNKDDSRDEGRRGGGEGRALRVENLKWRFGFGAGGFRRFVADVDRVRCGEWAAVEDYGICRCRDVRRGRLVWKGVIYHLV